jgi:hypothetical protein
MYQCSVPVIFCPCFSAEELLGVTVVELAKEGSTLGIVISGKWQVPHTLKVK